MALVIFCPLTIIEATANAHNDSHVGAECASTLVFEECSACLTFSQVSSRYLTKTLDGEALRGWNAGARVMTIRYENALFPIL